MIYSLGVLLQSIRALLEYIPLQYSFTILL